MAGKHAGRSGSRYRKLVAEVRRRETHCYRCGQRIDWAIPYRDPHTGEINGDSGTFEHKIPLSTRPDLAEDPANAGASHWRCNMRHGNKAAVAELGVASEAW